MRKSMEWRELEFCVELNDNKKILAMVMRVEHANGFQEMSMAEWEELLELGARRGAKDSVRTLLEMWRLRGGSELGLSAKEPGAATPLMCAARCFSPEDSAAIVRMLLPVSSAGGQDAMGRDALMIAAVQGNTEAARLMLAAKSGWLKEDLQGSTLLHGAAFSGCLEMLNVVWEGADGPRMVGAKNKLGLTPEQIAKSQGRHEAEAELSARRRVVAEAGELVASCADGAQQSKSAAPQPKTLRL